jgi:ferredoxin
MKELTKISYFSSSGNSLTIAKRISEKLGNVEIFSIPKIINNTIDFSAARIIIIFPIYIWGLPNIISNFLKKLDIKNETKLFAIAAYAGFAGDPFRKARKILAEKNMKLNSGYLIWMPENFTPKYGVWPKWLENFVLSRSESKINKVAKRIQEKKKGKYEKSYLGLNWFLTMMHNKLMHKLFTERSLIPKDYFSVNENCNSCKICEKICPVRNIFVKDKKPIWGNNCELCMGCFQWCPQKAIQFTYFKKNIILERYHHPEVTVKDFMMD